MDTEIDTDDKTSEILLAASNHDLEALRTLLRTGSANVQDADTGFTPLHPAIAACESEEDGPSEKVHGQANGNGESDTKDTAKAEEEAAAKTLQLLFQNGAIWNDLDANDETPGCLARRLGLTVLYNMIVEAGVRAELLLSRLDGYALLGDADGSEDEEDKEALNITEGDGEEAPELVDSQAPEIALEAPEDEGEDISAPTVMEPVLSNPDVNSADYLASGLIFTEDRLLDDDKNGVMMAWETNIMKRTADILTPWEGFRVLNIGHGMGIIDEFFRSKFPSSHHIVEAHPAVLRRMKEDGIYRRSGVTVHEGRWQDVLPKLVEQNVLFDAIYFDTFAEDYKTLKEFFSEYVIGLLDPAGGDNGEGGSFGFFNGLGADRQVCYDVYTKVVEMDLFDAGFDTEWEEIQIPNLQDSGEWEGVRRRYWVLDNYRLPTCRFLT
ncbi:hypothetical protein B0A49_05535 [Cryomyces minteri]|uniref:Arginine N-methyltransferase 2 n=1 Tax=Cryomyces minteri TaxID=331657 RepID=A0A4U0X8U0_9PEZI|nr:hypothetical protein B0A49_05535 [Cryomyces minteri]